MKKIILALAIALFSLNTSAFYTLNANCYLNSGSSASCQVCNYGYRVARCQMRITGRTFYGAWLNVASNITLLPGQCTQGFVAARNPYADRLVNAFARVHCN